MANVHSLSMEEVYSTYFSVIYNYVFYKLLNRENTEDVVSQVFLKAVKHLPGFDPQRASVKTWLFRITDNVLIDFYRRQKPNVSYEAEDSGLENTLCVHFDDQYDSVMEPRRRLVLAALRQLPERERTLVYYKYFLGITNREIARSMDMNENTVSAIMARARGKLKGILQSEI